MQLGVFETSTEDKDILIRWNFHLSFYTSDLPAAHFIAGISHWTFLSLLWSMKALRSDWPHTVCKETSRHEEEDDDPQRPPC